MKIDISEKNIEKAISAIRKLDNMEFDEITDSNKMSDLFSIVSVLNDFSYVLEDEMY